MEHHSSRRHHHHHSDGSSDAGKNRSHHHSSSRHEHGRHHSSSSSTLKWGGDSSGPKKLAGIGAFLCGAFGFVAISIHIIIRIVYAKNDEMPVFYLNLVSLAFAAVAFVCGFYGEIVLIRYPSRRLRLKLFFGMLITMFAIAISGFNLYRHYQLPALHGSHVAPAEETAGDTALPLSYPTATPPNLPASQPIERAEHSEPKSWYGEGGRDDMDAIFRAYPPKTEDAKLIASLTTRPVAYATLNLLNHSDKPVPFRINNITAIRQDGTSVLCLPILTLLRRDVPDAQLLIEKVEAIGDQGQLPPHKMASKLPVTFPSNLNWSEVSEVRVEIDGQSVKIDGKLLTEREIKELANQ